MRSFEVFKSLGARKRIYIFPRKNSEALSDQLVEYHLIAELHARAKRARVGGAP